MNCQETRQRLSTFADKELPDEELSGVRGHLATCPACRHELQEQGALDMLLKSSFAMEPSELSLEGIWPTVSDRIDGEGAGNGGGAARENGEIVFKSSSAMQMLRIPETAAPARTQLPAMPPPPARSGWVWPMALVVSSAIVVGGFLLYKQMTPPVTTSASALGEGHPAEGAPAATASSDGGMQVAMAPSSQPEPGEAATPGDESTTDEPDGDRKVASLSGRKKLRVARASGGPGKAEGDKTEPAAEPKVEPAAKAAARPAKKGDELDNLIDDAIGTAPAIAKKKKEEPAAKPAGDDQPEQLTMNQIRNGMNKVKGPVQACYDKYQIEGEARVSFSINPDGSVGECAIKGKFFGTDTGACVVAAVKKARFQTFSGKPMTIPSYVFLLQ